MVKISISDFKDFILLDILKMGKHVERHGYQLLFIIAYCHSVALNLCLYAHPPIETLFLVSLLLSRTPLYAAEVTFVQNPHIHVTNKR